MLAAYLLISAGATSAVVAAVGFSRQETSKLTLASNKQLPPYLAYLAAARTKIRSDVSRFALTPAVAGLAMSLRGGALSPRFSGKPAGSRKGHDFVEVASDDDFEGIDLEALLQSVTADIEEISVDPQELAHLGDFSGLGPLDFVRDGEADVDCVFQSKSEVGEDSRRGGIRPEQGVRRTEDKQEDQEHGPSDGCIESFGRDKEDRGVIAAEEDPPRVCKGSGMDNDDAGVEGKWEGFSAGGMDGSAQNYACPTHGEEEKEVDVSFSSRVAKDEERGIRGDGFEVFCEAREGGVKGEEEDDEDDGGNEALTVEESARREEQGEKGQSNGLSKKIIKEKEEDADGAGEEMLEEGGGEGEDNEEELLVNARHYEDKVVDDHDGEGIEDDGEEEEEYDEEQEEEEDDEEKEEEGREQEDDETGEVEEMLEEGGGEGEDNEEELVVNARHYEDKVVGDHDGEGIEDDGEEEEEYDEEQEEGEDDEAGEGEEMFEEGGGKGEKNQEELVVNARHYEDKVVRDHDGEGIEDDDEEEEEYDEEQEEEEYDEEKEEEYDEEKEEEGKEQEDDEAGEVEMLEEGGGEGEDNEEELVVNARHYGDKVVGDHDEEGIEDDGEEEEGYDEQEEGEDDGTGEGEEMLKGGGGEGEDNEEELVVNARHYEDKVVGDHDAGGIEDDGEEEEEYDEEQEEEEDDEEKEEEGKEQEDDEAGEVEEMLEERGGEGEDNEEELVVNARHYEDKVVGDHDEEGIEDDSVEEEGYDEEQEEGEDDEEEEEHEGGKSDDEEEEEYAEDDEEEDNKEGKAWLEEWEDDNDDKEHVRFEVENDADGQEDWDGREQSQVDEQKENDGGDGEEIMEEFEEREEESEWEAGNDEKSDESEIVDEWKNAAGIKEPRKIEQPQGMEGEDVVEDYDEGEETESQGGGVRDDWDGEEDEDEWDDEEKNDNDWDYEDTAGEEDEPVASGAKEEEEEEEMVEAAEEEEKDVGVEAEDHDGPKLKMGNKEIASASYTQLSRVESTSSGESSSEWVTDGEDSEGDDSLGEGSEGDDSLVESSEGDDSLGEEALVDDVSFDEAESEEEDTPGTESEGPTTPTSSHSYVKTHSLSSEREASSDGARHWGHSDGVPLPRQDLRENRDLPGGRARNALPEGRTAGVSRRRQKGKLPRSGTTVVSDSREENRAEPPTVVGASLATDEGDGDEAMVEDKILGMEEWIDTQRREPVPSKAPPRKTLDQVLEEGLGEIDDEDSASDIARQLREHRELGRRWVTGITTSTGLGRTRKQTMKVLLLQATANIIAGGGTPGTSPGRERLTLAGLAVGGGTIAVHKLLRRRIEAADFGKAADVEAETLSPLGMLLRKKASMGRISAKEHDLACLRSAARWGIILFAAGAMFSLVLGVGEPFFVCAALGLSRFFAEPIFFVHAMGRGGGPVGARRPFTPPSILNALLGSPHGLPGLDAGETEDKEETRHSFR